MWAKVNCVFNQLECLCLNFLLHFVSRTDGSVLTHLGGEVAAGLELLEECRHEDGGKEEHHAPEEDVWDEGSMRTTSPSLKHPMQHLALLLAPEHMVMMRMMGDKMVMMNTSFLN